MRTERARSTTPIALAALALTAVTALTACGADDEKAPDAPKTATGTLEQLAEQAECDPNIQTDAKELRQANCTTKDGKYVLATFTTDRGQREWINEANDYGGSYLVGRKWVVVGEEKVVTALRGRLGGTVETGSSHGGHSGSSADGGGGHEQEHSGHH
ncbi:MULTISPECIES: hypothetical protein [unclassified Streptomyces]|uniref:hypothetical protein n=1 Tax=Streptomyces sp. NPDC006678 TaxID=3157185 RepID=UPI0033CAC763